MSTEQDIISTTEAKTLYGLFRERLRRSPDAIAYRFYDAINEVWMDYSWNMMARDITRWQSALKKEKLMPGDRVAIMARNSRFWVIFDQAALGLGLVTVPLYTDDRVNNVEYILEHAGVKLLVIGGSLQWQRLHEQIKELKTLERIISIGQLSNTDEKRLEIMSLWLPEETGDLVDDDVNPDELASIVYTSGTTGLPKGVMLSHKNILSNSTSGIKAIPITSNDIFLSFLPLSHTLERTVGYYLPMMSGATVVHARSILNLAEDLKVIRPTILISVPRIYERIYARIHDRLQTKSSYVQNIFIIAVNIGWQYLNHQQGRGKHYFAVCLWPLFKKLIASKIEDQLGGRLRVAISGGAALAPEISKFFVGLGLPILQGYGLTEASPVVSVNRLDVNIPTSIGTVLPDVEVKLGEQGELLVKGNSVMLGYWENKAATKEVIDREGWLHTGDKAVIKEGHIYITGRLKEIIVLSTGEKVPPLDVELAVMTDGMFEQVMVIGESRPYLSALVVINRMKLDQLLETKESCSEKVIEELLQQRMNDKMKSFSGYMNIHRVTYMSEQWSVENGLLTPTMKIKRNKIKERFSTEIEKMYEGHN
jgi:long-chain acyl-CoA synthetase